MRDWVVGAAMIETEAMDEPPVTAVDGPPLLLVENRRHNGRSDWTTPGGVIDPGEEVLVGLTREVREETGLEVCDWSDLVYEIVAEAPGLGWRLTVEVYRAMSVSGQVAIGADPDGIVVAADWAPPARCAELLSLSQPWVREPLMEWVIDRFTVPRRFEFDIDGDRTTDLTVRRR